MTRLELKLLTKLEELRKGEWFEPGREQDRIACESLRRAGYLLFRHQPNGILINGYALNRKSRIYGQAKAVGLF